MRLQTLFFTAAISMAFLSCSNPHENIFIYKDRLYTTTSVSEFEVQHFSRHAGKETVVIHTTKDSSRLKKIKSLCKDIELHCHFLEIENQELTKENEKEIHKISEKMKYNKFLLLSPNNKMTAYFTTLYSSFYYGANENEAQNIFDRLGIDENPRELLK